MSGKSCFCIFILSKLQERSGASIRAVSIGYHPILVHENEVRQAEIQTQRHRVTDAETQTQRHSHRDTETQRHRRRDTEAQRHKYTLTQ